MCYLFAVQKLIMSDGIYRNCNLWVPTLKLGFYRKLKTIINQFTVQMSNQLYASNFRFRIFIEIPTICDQRTLKVCLCRTEHTMSNGIALLTFGAFCKIHFFNIFIWKVARYTNVVHIRENKKVIQYFRDISGNVAQIPSNMPVSI